MTLLYFVCMTTVINIHFLSFCEGLSPTSSKLGTLPSSSLPSLFAGPVAQIQRSIIKQQLSKAAKDKNEDLIISLVDELSELNPTAVPTKGLLGYKSSNSAAFSEPPLDGAWKLLYTNARDAEAPARTQANQNEQFGDQVEEGIQVKTGQRINAAMGLCVNYIQLTSSSRRPPFDKLEITIQMTPLSDTRVRLDFQKGRALNEGVILPALKDFTFYFPPPAFGDILARLQGKDPIKEPPAYFDVLYLDDTIRVHRTGEGKIFIQQRDRSY